MVELKHKIEYVIAEANDAHASTMTSLGKLVFADIHDRHKRSLTEDDSSANIDSLSLAYENIFFMPLDIIEKYSAIISTLDLSYNNFSRNLQFLSEFDNLTSLNLDHNNIDDNTILPYMSKLELLWLNHNSIEYLFPFIKNLHESVPNLRYLCLMGNKAAPSYLTGGNFFDYLQYRLFVISWFPHLVHLDDRKVTLDERKEVKRLYKRPLLDTLVEHIPIPECIKRLHKRPYNTFSRPNKQKVPKGMNSVI